MAAKEEDNRLVHLDLKGAPPKIEYLEQIFPLFKKWGATGLLIEYEDMFPYTGELAELASEYAYSKEGIERILQLAEDNDLLVVPLVQTFGHLEFVLKHEKFKSLREMSNVPTALCPSNPDSITAVSMMIDQVIDLHPGLRWFHIGADEVFHLGICERCKKRMEEENITLQQLFFSHTRSVLLYIKEKYPSLTAIMWDDMLRFTELPVLLESGLSGLVEVMVWHYLTSFLLPQDIWEKFSKVFPNIWIGSAFKGATGSCLYVTNISFHIDNHLAWLSVIQKEKLKFQNIRGFAVTGWQRYDHYAILCELLPQALPSLGICLNVINKGTFTQEIHTSVSNDLKFKSLIPLNPFQCTDIPPCDFPGSEIYSDMLHFVHLEVAYEDYFHNEGKITWMNEYHVKRNFINPVHVEPLLAQGVRILGSLRQLQSRLKNSFSDIFYDHTIEEWLEVFINPKIRKLSKMVELVRTQLDSDRDGKTKSMQTSESNYN